MHVKYLALLALRHSQPPNGARPHASSAKLSQAEAENPKDLPQPELLDRSVQKRGPQGGSEAARGMAAHLCSK